MNKFRSSIIWQLVLPIPVLLAVAIVAVWLGLPRYVAGKAQEDAIRNATQTVGQFKTLRAYYTDKVVKKVLSGGGTASFRHETEAGSIPLPATMIHDMSELLSEEAVSLQLFSPYPFPNRNDRQLDGFQREAWDFLVANPDRIYSRRETQDGKEVVRVAIADRMVAESCVACHNTRPDTPKNDWKLGDVRGVLEVDAVIDEQLAAGAQLSNSILLFTALGGGAIILLTVFVGRRVVSPIVQMTGAMGTLAGGNFSIEVPARERRDEIGAMASAVEVFKQNAVEMERMQEAERKAEQERAEAERRAQAEKLEAERKAQAEKEEAERQAQEERRRAMRELADRFDASVAAVIGTVTTASTELRSTAESMSATAEETSRQSTAVATASEEASTNVQTVASAAEEMSSSVEEIGRQVTQSAEIARQAVAEAGRTNETVQGLAEAAQKIGEVVNLISDIAEQTNLLALNATIEAARAGDAGKGFAVVASEVKSLATQTAKATEEIASQIGAVQSVTGTAVEAIQSIGTTIGQINEIATTIASAVEEQGAATQEIARNATEAAKGTTEVSSNITNVSQAANETGAAAKQVLDSAGQLSEEAVKLKTEVEKFLAEVRAA